MLTICTAGIGQKSMDKKKEKFRKKATLTKVGEYYKFYDKKKKRFGVADKELNKIIKAQYEWLYIDKDNRFVYVANQAQLYHHNFSSITNLHKLDFEGNVIDDLDAYRGYEFSGDIQETEFGDYMFVLENSEDKTGYYVDMDLEKVTTSSHRYYRLSELGYYFATSINDLDNTKQIEVVHVKNGVIHSRQYDKDFRFNYFLSDHFGSMYKDGYYQLYDYSSGKPELVSPYKFDFISHFRGHVKGHGFKLKKDNLTSVFDTKKKTLSVKEIEVEKITRFSETENAYHTITGRTYNIYSVDRGRFLLPDNTTLLQNTTGLRQGCYVIKVENNGQREMGVYDAVFDEYPYPLADQSISIAGISIDPKTKKIEGAVTITKNGESVKVKAKEVCREN